MEYQILLYYSYVAISEPEALAQRQRALCQELGLKGRIIIATEGINGTIEGSTEATEQYIERSLIEPSFLAVAYKKSKGTGTAFPKLSVKVRSEIISAHLDERDVNPAKVTGVYLQPKELHSWIKSDKDFYIVDIRNDYEHVVGHFQNSILLNIQNFRQLPDVLPTIEHLKGETVLTVCTGGVRCEKASGYLVENGFADVYQLDGGIVSYMELYPNEDFLGSLYVFDNRITMAFNSDVSPRQIVGRCERCQTTSETYINCANSECNRHFICCQMCTASEVASYCGSLCFAVKADTPAGFYC